MIGGNHVNFFYYLKGMDRYKNSVLIALNKTQLIALVKYAN